MEPTPELFREVLGRLAAGVTVVTTLDAAGEPRGLTATAVSSVSLDPPLVLVCAGRDSHTCEAIRSSGRYALNFLHSGAPDLSDRFAAANERKFDGVDWREGPYGLPLLHACLAWLECAVESEVEAGDHTIFIARVLAAAVERAESEPLVHYRGQYRILREGSGS